jgi:hypothetical protein
MADLESSLSAERHRDLKGRNVEPWVRRAGLTLFGVIVVVALAGQLGQRATSSSTAAPAATLQVSSPTKLRGGLLYQARFTITARRRLAHTRLVLSPGWFDGQTLNTTEPQASEETNENGSVAFAYGALPAGERLHVWLEYQINPTTTGSRKQTAVLQDGETQIATLTRKTRIFP